MTKPTIAIIGASIAGCATANLLTRAGFQVQVFEKRAPEAMAELGAGIVLPSDLIRELKNQKVIDKNLSSLLLSTRDFFIRATKKGKEKFVGSIPMSAEAIHWGELYQQVEKQLPKNIVAYNSKVKELQVQSDKVLLLFDNDKSFVADYVICADGYQSLGRRVLYPDIQPKFTDYTCWQGVCYYNDVTISEHLNKKVLYYVYEKGVLLIYEIPSLRKDISNITWFFYEVIDNEHPFVKDNKVHVNIYQDDMTENYKNYLHQLAKAHLPDFAKDVIIKTEKPFTHAIYDTSVPKYYADRVALIGDAGILLRPHLGSGATKALQDALALFQSVNKEVNFEAAIKEWAHKRQQAADHLFGLSRAFGDFLVTKQPDWKNLDEKELNCLWDGIVKGYNWYQHK